MRLVGISAVRNEADIIEAFVRHSLTLCDALLILDNGSTDATRDMLAELENEGLSLRILEDAVIGYHQSEWMTRLMRTAVGELGADWVLPLDADEFLAPDSKGELVDYLTQAPGPITVPWRNYIPTPSDDPDELNPAIRIRHRLGSASGSMVKVIVPRLVAQSAVLAMGSHGLEGSLSDASPLLPSPGIALCHFPVRSPEQYASKIAIAELQWSARAAGPRVHGVHVTEPFQQLLTDWKHFTETYEDNVRRYLLPGHATSDPEIILDPFPYRGGVLRYTTRSRPSEPWRSILEYTHFLAEQYSALAPALTATTQQAAEDRADYKARLEVLTRALEARTNRLRRTARSVHRLRRRLDAIHTSYSWRITRPLRALKSIVKARRRTSKRLR